MNDNSSIKNLKLLWWLRNIAIIGQTIAVYIVTHPLDIPLEVTPLWVIILSLALINAVTYIRIKKAYNISQGEFLGQLLVDIMSLGSLLYFTGGASNPFASLFILQIMIAAIMLKPVYTWFLAALSVGIYTSLMFYNVEVPYFMHHHIGEFFSLHVQGMWISFMLLSAIVAWFIVRMNNTIRQKEVLLLEAEKIGALGTLATSAAHELGTPLATLAILSEDLDDKTRESFNEQITRCKEIISRIAAASGVARAESGSKMTLTNFLNGITLKWKDEHNDTEFNIETEGEGNPDIIAEEGLRQSLINLLNNAYDASNDYVSFAANWTSDALTIIIKDKGSGIEESIKGTIGQAGVTTKHEGFGLGLFLAKSVVSRLEGSLTLKNAKEGGAICTVTIPLRRIAV